MSHTVHLEPTQFYTAPFCKQSTVNCAIPTILPYVKSEPLVGQ